MKPTWQELYDELQALKAEFKAIKENEINPKADESFEDWLERLKTLVEKPKITNTALLS